MAKIYSSGEATQETFARFLHLNDGGIPKGVLTDLKRLDSHLYGFHPGTVTVLASKPGVGKTAYALNIVHHTLLKNARTRILYCSTDLDHIQLMIRLLCMECKMDFNRMQQGDLANESFAPLGSAAKWIKNLPFWIDPSCGISIDELNRKIREFLTNQPLDLVIIDPLELLKYGDTQIAAKTIRQLAKEMQIPILLLTSVHSRNKHCKIQDLEEGIADNSDTVMFLERERKHMSDGRMSSAELVIARNTISFAGRIPMEYDSKTMTFTELKEDECEDVSVDDTVEGGLK